MGKRQMHRPIALLPIPINLGGVAQKVKLEWSTLRQKGKGGV